jgi:rfaE bifunctional protein kinase chain/domain
MKKYDSANIKQVFKTFNSLNVLVIGDVMIDAYMWGDVSRISPEAPVPVVSITKKENRLGGAANVALNLQAMGAKPILCSVIGNDDNALIFTNLLKAQKLVAKGIIKDKSRPTTVKTRIIGNNHQMLRVDDEIETDITSKSQNDLIKRIKSIIDNSSIDAIVFEDYDKGCITPKLISSIVSYANQKSIPTVVDPKKKNFLEYKEVSMFKPNLKELKEGLKIDFDHKNIVELKNASTKFIRKQKIKSLLITLSEMGVYIHSTKSKKLIPAHIRNISDVSGAGDTVVSVAALCLALNLPNELTATLSNLAGGLVCEKIGVVPIDKNQLLNEAIQLKL